MPDRTPDDIAAWLRQTHGGDWPPALAAGAAALAADLNALVRRAAADLPLEREPLDFQRLTSTVAVPEADDA